MKFNWTLATLVLHLASAFCEAAPSTHGSDLGKGEVQTLTVSRSPLRKSLFGVCVFIENNINYGTDGGIYNEIIRNRAFQEGGQGENIGGGTLAFWTSFNKAALKLTHDSQLSPSLPLSVIVSGAGTMGAKTYGLRNSGFFGIPVKPQDYSVSFRVRADHAASIVFTAGLYKSDGVTSFATVDKIVAVTTTWQEIKVTLSNKQSSTALDNLFGLDVPAGTGDVQLNLISVFPPTWKGTTARPDLAEAVADLKPVYFRLPGGNDLMGSSLRTHLAWDKMTGSLSIRPGRKGTWAGWNTEGYGLNEAFDLFTRMGALPVLGVFAGYAVNKESVAKTDMGPVVKSAVDQIHYLSDAAGSSELAKKRASDGFSHPWKLDVIQVGNEDWISPEAIETYRYRYPAIRDALQSAFPSKLIMSSSPNLEPKSQLNAIDQHDYNTPANLISRWDERDRWPRNGTTVWNLEFSVVNSGRCGSKHLFSNPCRLERPTQEGAVAEATFMMGFERNGDITPSAAYAPLLLNSASSQWKPDLIEFNILNLALSPSYYVQHAFGNNRITDTHNVTSSQPPGPIYWSVGTTSGDGKGGYTVKLSNVDVSSSHSVVVKLDEGEFAATGSLWLLASKDPQATNTLEKPDTVKPETRALSENDFDRGALRLDLPPNSFAVALLHKEIEATAKIPA